MYVVKTSSAAITHVAPHVFYNGSYPTKPLTKGNHGDFEVQTRVFTWAPAPVKGVITVTGHWASGDVKATLDVDLPAGDSVNVVKLKATASDIDLWWPVGLGDQPLYNVSVSFASSSAQNADNTATRRIGFRYFALVTGNDTDPAYVNASRNADGTDSMGMLFRVNGAVVYSRGELVHCIPLAQHL